MGLQRKPHPSLVASSSQGWIRKGELYDIELREYLALSPSQKHILKQYRTGVDFPSRAVIIDPYFLGVWLGDGTSCRMDFSTPDTEVVEAVGAVTNPESITFRNAEKREGKCPQWQVSPVANPFLAAAFNTPLAGVVFAVELGDEAGASAGIRGKGDGR